MSACHPVELTLIETHLHELWWVLYGDAVLCSLHLSPSSSDLSQTIIIVYARASAENKFLNFISCFLNARSERNEQLLPIILLFATSTHKKKSTNGNVK